MNVIVIGNLISLVGALLMVGIGFLQKKKQILLAQCVQFSILGVANLILGGITGFASAIISAFRNLICCITKFTIPLKLLFIAVQLVFSILVNQMGLIGWLPIISACFYTWFLDVKSETRLKLLIIGTQALWVVYDFYLQNYTSFAFDIFTIVTNAIGMWRLWQKKKTTTAEST